MGTVHGPNRFKMFMDLGQTKQDEIRGEHCASIVPPGARVKARTQH
jgi:hypothetical protein